MLLIYSVYFCWNGTTAFHAFDVEEIILRFEKIDVNYDERYGYNSFYKSILNGLLDPRSGEPVPRAAVWSYVEFVYPGMEFLL